MFETKKRDKREKRCQRIGYSIRKFVCSLLTASTEKVSLSLSSSFLMWNHHRTRRKEDYKHTHRERERREREREREREENESSKTLLLFVCKDTTKAADDDFCGSKKSAGKKNELRDIIN